MSASSRPRAESKIFDRSDIKAIHKILTRSFDEIENKIIACGHSGTEVPSELSKQYSLAIKHLVVLLRSVALQSFSQIDFDAYFEGFKINKLNKKYSNAQDNFVKAILIDIVDRSDLSASLLVLERWKRVMQISLNNHDYYTAESVSLALGFVHTDLKLLLPMSVQKKIIETTQKLSHRHLLVDTMEAAYDKGRKIVPNVMDMQDKFEKLEAKYDVLIADAEKSKDILKAVELKGMQNENLRHLVKSFKYMFKEIQTKYLSEAEDKLVIKVIKYLQKKSDSDDFLKFSHNPKVISENSLLIRHQLKLSETEKKIQDEQEQLNVYLRLKDTYLDDQERVKHAPKKIAACLKLFSLLADDKKNYAEKHDEIQILVDDKDMIFDSRLSAIKGNILSTLHNLTIFIHMRAELITSKVETKNDSSKLQVKKSQKRNSDKLQRRSTVTSFKSSSSEKKFHTKKKEIKFCEKTDDGSRSPEVLKANTTPSITEIKVHRLVVHAEAASAAASAPAPNQDDAFKPKLPLLQLPKPAIIVSPLNSPTTPHSGKSIGSPKKIGDDGLAKSSSVPDNISPRKVSADPSRTRAGSSPIRLIPRKASGKIQMVINTLEPTTVIEKPITPRTPRGEISNRALQFQTIVSMFESQQTVITQQAVTPRGALINQGLFGGQQKNQVQNTPKSSDGPALPKV